MKNWIVYTWVGLLALICFAAIPTCTYSGGESFYNATGKQSAFDPQGPIAQNQLDIFYVTLWVTTFLFITVGGTLGYTIWKYRQKKGDDPDFIPAQSHGHPLVEVGLVVISAGLLVIIAIPTFGGIILKKTVPVGPDEYLEVNVRGYQWWWGFEYPELGIHTANEIVFPAGKVVKLNLHANDVIHSFWLPKLAGKTDLMPGQTNEMWIQADEPGYFWGQCAEYCGESHAYMLFRAKALSPEDWEAWKAGQQRKTVQADGSYEPVLADASAPETTPAEILRGARLFKDNCARCHSVDPAVQTNGPNLAHFASRSSIAAGWMENEPENLHRWIKEPQNVKPGNFMWYGFPNPGDPKGPPMMEGLIDANLSDRDVDALVAYLYTLK